MKVLFTALIGPSSEPALPESAPPGWQAICFTDRPRYGPGWEFRKVVADSWPRNVARRLKILAHVALPHADVSVWMDASFRVACDLDSITERALAQHDFATHRHFVRDCVYEEARTIVEFMRAPRQVLDRQAKAYRASGYPEHAGLYETGVVFRRHTETIRRLNCCWWSLVQGGSCRDQISLPVALWQTGVACNGIAASEVRSRNFLLSLNGMG